MKSPSVSASAFRSYVRDLADLNNEAMRAGGLPFPFVDLAREHLDGRAGRELRASVELGELRRMGAFFTGDKLAAAAVGLAGDPRRWGRVHDPACGCGDLLLAAAWQLPVCPNLSDTLEVWGSILSGRDLVPEFIEVARHRLALVAMVRGSKPDRRDQRLDEALGNVRVGDGRSDTPLAVAGTVLLNPPYGRVVAPDSTAFAQGVVTEAALWTVDVLETMAEGAQLIAVLPDVLRSGSRYRAFREFVGGLANVRSIESYGRFDALTDVDVFVSRLRRTKRGRGWPASESAAPTTLADVCTISVGAVVDRRDLHRGSWSPYITTRDLPQHGFFVPTRHRRFAKRRFTPPFVVVRRTSRPSGALPRLRAVVIGGERPVAVENHLIVLEPNEPGLAACERLATALQDSQITAWLDGRIRCRHLTVQALREAPAPQTIRDLASAP
ncbi:MAG: hypothetical protein QOC78_1280 [Solirubrobacteraceae bacterium]|nr:hypothetical protein [Solirubrobacteraceae bacterium]